MTREEVLQKALDGAKHNNVLLELCTGFGKTKIALEIVKELHYNSILVVVPRLALIKSWEAEIKKWHYTGNVIFKTYIGLNSNYRADCVIYDECHRMTDRAFSSAREIKATKVLLLSATVPLDKLRLLKFFDPIHITVPLSEAIYENVVAKPEVVLIPLSFNNDLQYKYIWSNKPNPFVCKYKDKWKYFPVASKTKRGLIIECNQSEYASLLEDQISLYKKYYINLHSSQLKNKYLRLCKDRLEWLSSLKKEAVKEYLDEIEDKRAIIFCSTIEQSEDICTNSITSKSGIENLKLFNEGKINHISSVNMLNEGINLSECEYGIFISLSSSCITQVQKIGRLLRHKYPKIVIFYFKGREEEIKDSMLDIIK